MQHVLVIDDDPVLLAMVGDSLPGHRACFILVLA